ncbi:uncharacterized protein [Symphalangus syndactylus]|uniref:uncharacterized protein n=1 Tax=Symphalangus syndactylus TaxID=9590 RepID=UPI0030077D95
MGGSASLPADSPLLCLLNNLSAPGLAADLKPKHLIKYCTQDWPTYPLDNQNKWPPYGSVYPSILQDLYNYCEQTGKWAEIPYLHGFFLLKALKLSPSPNPLIPSTPDFDPADEPPPYHHPQPFPLAAAQPARAPPPAAASPPSANPGLPCPSSPTSPTSFPPPFSPPTTPSRSHLPVLTPLREVAGAEGIVRIHVPFSMADLSQIEKCLGSYTSNPASYIKEFQYLLQAYSLTFHDIYLVLSNTLLSEERRRVWEQARTYADQVHQTTPALPIGVQAVPEQEPNWDYNTQIGVAARDHFATCLITGLRKAAQKAVNFEKLHEIVPEKHENPSAFLDRLTQALQQYTNIDPEAPDGRQLLMSHFFTQSFPDIRAKLKKLDRGPFTPQTEILATAFKHYSCG